MSYFIALVPPFLDSIAVYVDKFLLSKFDVNSTIITIYSGLFAFLAGLIVLLFTGYTPVDTKSALIVFLSGFLGIFYLFAYFKALTYDEGSRVGALFQFIPVMVLILSFLLLGEKLLFKQYIGTTFIVVAGFLLSIDKLGTGVFRVNKAFWFMLLACFFSASVYVLFKMGVKELGFWVSLPYEGFGSLAATLCIILYRENFALLRNSKKIFTKTIVGYMTLVELLARISRYVLFYALTFIPASIASVLMGFQPLFLLILGVGLSLWFPYIIKEVVTKKTVGLKLGATAGIFLGLYFIFL
jgi:drug/metabolite transporter (DMT)-like permease